MSNETELEENQVGTEPVVDATESVPRGDAGAYAGDLSWSPGMLLKRAREQQGLTREDLSVQTKLSVATVRALEEDDFDTLSEAVYTRGYYRRCASALCLPSGEVVNAYERASGEPPPQPLPLKPTYGQEQLHTPGRWMPYLLFMVAAACLVALVMWWMQRPQPSAPTTGGSEVSSLAPNNDQAVGNDSGPSGAASLSVVSAQNSVSQNSVSSGAQPGGQSVPESSSPNSLPSLPGPATPSTQVAESSSKTASTRTAPAPAAGGTAKLQPGQSAAAQSASDQKTVQATGASSAGAHTLTLSFKQKSWVEVTDAGGKTLLSGLMNGGSQKEVHGKPPYDVLLGYAPGVQLSYGGQTVPLDSHVRSNNTAHLTVGQSQ